MLDAIKRAATCDQAERTGLRAEGFVLGAERLKAHKEEPDSFVRYQTDITLHYRYGPRHRALDASVAA